MRRDRERQPDARPYLRVTRRQRQIVSLAAEGLTDKEIAERLSLSVSTVRTHLERFYAANGLRNKAEAVASWLRHLESLRRRREATRPKRT